MPMERAHYRRDGGISLTNLKVQARTAVVPLDRRRASYAIRLSSFALAYLSMTIWLETQH